LPVELLFPSPDEIEDAVTRELGGSSMFAARFRESAARALLLPRNHVGKRTPLWAQRKRSADLLAVAQQYPSFPIVLETYRECLRDAFDLPALVDILRAVESRKIRVTTVDLTTPSPMAASLLFSFVGNFIYDQDAPAAERRAQALTIDHAQLRELLGETELRKLLDADVVLEHGRQLQRLDRPLRHADALHDLLLWLGDLGEDEIRRRTDPALVTDGKPAVSPATVTSWIEGLVRDRRLVRVRIAGEERFVAVEDVARYRDALGVVVERGLPEVFLAATSDALTSLVARYARTHGPLLASEIAARWGLGEGSVTAALERLVASGKVVTGTFLPSSSAARARGRTHGAPVEYCDVEVLGSLKRKTLARLRKSIEPVAPEAFARFLSDWQGIVSPDDTRAARLAASPTETLLRAIGQLEGCPIPASVLESEVLPARVPGYRSHLLDQLLASGEVVWAGLEPIGSQDGRVALYLADREPLLARGPAGEGAVPRGALHEKLRELFARRGALFFAEITRALATYPNDVLGALWDLVWAGEVTNDTLEPLRSNLAAGRKTERRGRPSPRPARLGPRGSEGRWSLRRARWEREPSSTERATAIAKAMLERYGVVLREAPHAEGLPGGFANVYDVYRALEDQGRVRRGYFVAERGATQFALPGAEERLRTKRPDDEEPRTLVLAATDPANPWGSLVPWPRGDAPRTPVAEGEESLAAEPSATGRGAQRAPGARVILHDGRLLAWVGRGGQNLATFLPRDEPDRGHASEALARALVGMARRRARTAMLVTIDGAPALESAFARTLAAHGFAGRRGALVYIPTVPHGPDGRRGESARTFAERGVVTFTREPPPPASRPPTSASTSPPSYDGEEWDDDEVDFDADELEQDLAAIGAGAAALDLDTPPEDEPAADAPRLDVAESPGATTPDAHA
ncbi:MAG TPA: DEAD/DEAH box helicase, partial [Labilithrix sp.]|nr:DEAD/DEAH box helicase [Labilithrix sp.]